MAAAGASALRRRERRRREVEARGCWSMRPARGSARCCSRRDRPERDRRSVRLVKGSHIVVAHACSITTARYIFQNAGRAHHLRDSVRARLHADRHHRPRLSAAIPATVAAIAKRDRLSVRRRQRIFRAARRRARMWCGPIPACGRSMTTAPRSAQEATRDYVLELEAASGAAAAAQRLRRQDHDLSPAGGSGAGQARAGCLRQARPAVDRRGAAAGRRLSGRRRSRRSMRRAEDGLPVPRRRPRSPARARLRHADAQMLLGRRRRLPISAGTSAPTSTRPRCAI